MYVLLESLSKLDCLDVAVDRIEQRLPVELYMIVDKTNQEVDLRHPRHLRGASPLGERSSNLPILGPTGRDVVLSDFLWTLYSKFEAVAEGHRAVHDIIVGIARRKGLRPVEKLMRGFKEMWKLYQSEVSGIAYV